MGIKTAHKHLKYMALPVDCRFCLHLKFTIERDKKIPKKCNGNIKFYEILLTKYV